MELFVPLITPLDDAGNVCAVSLERLVDSLRPWVDGVIPALSSGEGWALTDSQWEDVVAASVHATEGLALYFGIEQPTTAAVLRRIEAIPDSGEVAGVAVTTPYGAGVSQTAMMAHVREVCGAADARGLRVMFYNEAAISRNVVAMPTLAAICAVPGIHSVKESSGDAQVTAGLLDVAGSTPVYQGWEHLLDHHQGCAGAVLALANVEPELCKRALGPSGSAEVLALVQQASAAHGLDAADWYRSIKRELHRRGIIGTSKTLPGSA